MMATAAPAAAPNEGLSGRDWDDLRWLLDIFEEWLLYAEPSTIRELDRLLDSVGAFAGSAAVIERLTALQKTLHRQRSK